MNKAISFIFHTAMFAILAVGIVALFSEPADNSQSWLTNFILSKTIAAIAFGSLYLTHKNADTIHIWLNSLGHTEN